jgi:hypothetical protein
VRSASDLPGAPSPSAAEGLCGVAMLKVAMELKKRPSVPVDSVVQDVLRAMGIDAAAFRKYVANQAGVLQGLEKMRRGHGT